MTDNQKEMIQIQQLKEQYEAMNTYMYRQGFMWVAVGFGLQIVFYVIFCMTSRICSKRKKAPKEYIEIKKEKSEIDGLWRSLRNTRVKIARVSNILKKIS